MENNKLFKMGEVLTLVIVVATLLLSIFYNKAFIPSFMLILSLLLFEVCYNIKDSKKTLMYVLFIVGVLLIFGSLAYTIMRLS